MTIRQLEPGEVSVLRALRDHRNPTGWLSCVEVAQQIDMPQWYVRSKLREMRRYLLVTRGTGVPHAYKWSITEHGIQRLCAVDQLRLVR